MQPPPWIFAFPSEFFENIFHGYVFGVKESNGDNEKILSLLHDLENQGQTPFCMTFLISGCKHDTKLILVSILTFSRSGISNMWKKIAWIWRLTLELKVTHIHCMTFHISGWIQATDLILVVDSNICKSRGSQNTQNKSPDLDVRPWKSRSNTFLHDLSYLRLQTWYEVDLSVRF